MDNQSQTRSSESVLLNPEDETLNDADDRLPYDKILKDVNERKRGKNINYEIPFTFDNLKSMEERIKRGEIKGDFWERKNFDKKNGKIRYYCRYMSYGCRVAMYLQLGQNLCFVSEDEHTNHPDNLKPRVELDQEVFDRIEEFTIWVLNQPPSLTSF